MYEVYKMCMHMYVYVYEHAYLYYMHEHRLFILSDESNFIYYLYQINKNRQLA